MKMKKKIAGIFLALVLVFQFAEGIVISSKAVDYSSDTSWFSINSVSLGDWSWWPVGYNINMTVTNNSNYIVTGFDYEVTGTSDSGDISWSGTVSNLTVAAASSGNANFIVTQNNQLSNINLTSVKITSLRYMEMSSIYSWLTPTQVSFSYSWGTWYNLTYTLQNTSGKRDVTAFSYEVVVVYEKDGAKTSKTLTGTQNIAIAKNTVGNGTVSIDAGETLTNGYLSSFKITGCTYNLNSNVSAPTLNGIMNPQITSDYEDGDDLSEVKMYVTWARVKFGSYYMTYDSNNQDSNKGDIYWRVLAVDGDNLLLMADQALASMPYSSNMGNATWETSSVREFLNDDFYNEAFTAEQKAAIVSKTLDNSGKGTKSTGGNNTTDNVYILSVDEINNKAYGLLSGEVNGVAETRQIAASDYVVATNSNLKLSSDDNNYCNYFLRTPGYYQYDVAGVSSLGKISTTGWRTYTKTAAVVPVITVAKGAVEFVDSVSKVTSAENDTLVKNSVSSKTTAKVSIGDTKVVENVTYIVTKSTSKTKTVSVKTVKKTAKNVTIPSTIKINGDKYKVTAIKTNAFKNAKNKLKKITIKSINISSMNKKAFTGLSKNTTVKIVKSKYKKYKKMITNKKVKIKSL